MHRDPNRLCERFDTGIECAEEDCTANPIHMVRGTNPLEKRLDTFGAADVQQSRDDVRIDTTGKCFGSGDSGLQLIAWCEA